MKSRITTLLFLFVFQFFHAQAQDAVSVFHRLLISSEKGELMVVKLKKVGFWVTPGFYQTPDQSIKQGVDSLMATFGLEASSIELKGLFMLKRDINGKQSSSLRNVFLTKVATKDQKMPKGIEEIRWLPAKQALDLITFPHIHAMIAPIMEKPEQVWAGTVLQFKEGDAWKVKVLEEFYAISDAQSAEANGSSTVESTEISRQIDALFSKYNANSPGLAVAVVKDGKTIHQKGYGMANLEYDIPINSQTVFHIASVSKQFTAFSIYLLKEKGLVSLKDDIRKYFPELPDYGHSITIEQLLAHTSGLRDQWALLTLAGWHLEDVITTEQVMKLIISQKSLNFEPGTKFSYCNSSYTLLAELVKRTSGQSLAVFAKENIFEPLGMKHTQFYDESHKTIKNRAYSYELKDGVYVKKKLNYSNIGPTSLFSTVEDLSKWAGNFADPKVGSPKLLENFNQISQLNDGTNVIFKMINADTLYHAKGQIHRNYRGVEIFKHGGHDAGFRAFLARFPNENMSIVTLSNDEHYEIFARGLEIAEYCLGDQMNEPKPMVKKAKVEEISSPKTYNADLSQFIGRYFSGELSTFYHIQQKDDKLVISHKRLPDMVLTRLGEYQFAGNNYFDFTIEFSSNSKGEVEGFKISNFGVHDLAFEKASNTSK